MSYRYTHLRLRDAVMLGTEETSFRCGTVGAVGLASSNNCDSITPGRDDVDEGPVPVKPGQRGDGFVVVRSVHDRLQGKVVVRRMLIPYGNVLGAE